MRRVGSGAVEVSQAVIGPGLWETVGMPKDRNKTYSDRQSEASRAKKQPKKQKASREDSSKAPARFNSLNNATEGHQAVVEDSARGIVQAEPPALTVGTSGGCRAPLDWTAGGGCPHIILYALFFYSFCRSRNLAGVRWLLQTLFPALRPHALPCLRRRGVRSA